MTPPKQVAPDVGLQSKPPVSRWSLVQRLTREVHLSRSDNERAAIAAPLVSQVCRADACAVYLRVEGTAQTQTVLVASSGAPPSPRLAAAELWERLDRCFPSPYVIDASPEAPALLDCSDLSSVAVMALGWPGDPNGLLVVGRHSARQFDDDDLAALTCCAQALSYAMLSSATTGGNADAAPDATQLHAQRLETLGTLACGVAHDFNNLLTGVIAGAQLAQREVPAGSDLHLRMGEVVRHAERATELAHQLLRFSRLDVDAYANVDPQPMLKETIKLLERILPETIHLRFCCETEGHQVTMPPVQLQQILVNLCVNARDAMPHGGTLTVTARLTAPAENGVSGDGRRLLLCVEDSGVGISPELLDRIHLPFFTTKRPGEGTGLGLSMVHSIVHRHGGTMSIESEQGVGTRVTILLPTSDAAAACDVAEPSSMPALQPASAGARVLVVEDEDALREVMQRTLQAAGYEVVCAADGRQAVEVLEQFGAGISCVVTDMVMPRMGGVELARQVRRRWPDVRFVVITGYDARLAPASEDEFRSCPVLQKPFRIQQLTQAVHEAMQT